MNKKLILLLVLVPATLNLYSLEMQLSSEELGFYFTPEYNRALNFCWNLSTVGAAVFNEQYIVKGGLALGGAGSVFDMKVFTGVEYKLPLSIPLNVSLAYNYNGLPAYENHAHSILPLVSLTYPQAGIAMGPNFRFTRFFGEQPVFESMLSFSAYVNFINNDVLKLGLEFANFDDFTYRNFGSYFLKLYSAIPLDKNLSLINEIELDQGGSVGLSANFYGLLYRGGVQFIW